jgi:hypothetical protein
MLYYSELTSFTGGWGQQARSQSDQADMFQRGARAIPHPLMWNRYPIPGSVRMWAGWAANYIQVNRIQWQPPAVQALVKHPLSQ